MESGDRQPKNTVPKGVWWYSTAFATIILAVATTRPALAGCPCGKSWPHLICHKHGLAYATGTGDIVNADGDGSWYWVRSPDQERRVVSSLFNRYCIRCHGVDGRGVWDIPECPISRMHSGSRLVPTTTDQG